MIEPERPDRQIIKSTDARQGVTGHNVRAVLILSLLLAAAAGAAVVGYFRTTHGSSVKELPDKHQTSLVRDATWLSEKVSIPIQG
jgi:hypothetical protein